MHKVKFLVITPYLRWGPSWIYYELPLGLGYISATLQRAGYEGELVNINEYNSDCVNDVLIEKLKGVDVVLIGGLSGHYNSIKNLMKGIKGFNPDILRIIGGGVVTASPDIVLNSIDAHIAVKGEGEGCVLRIFEDIDKIDRTKKLIYSSDIFIDMDTLPIADYDGLITPNWFERLHPSSNIWIYAEDKPRFLPLDTSRGCPFNCTFCFSPLGRKYRERSIPKSMEVIEHLIHKYDLNIVSIYDEVLSINPERLHKFCDAIKKLNIKWVASLRASMATLDNLKALKDSGCYCLTIGVENNNPEILKSMNKNLKIEDAEQALENCQKVKIGCLSNILTMDIAETPETVDRSIAWMKEHQKYTLNCSHLQAYPGTELHRRFVELGKIDTLTYLENNCPFPIQPPGFTNEEYLYSLEKIRLYRVYNDYYYADTLEFRVSGSDQLGSLYYIKVVCPHCKEIVEYDNVTLMTYMKLTNENGTRLRLSCRKCHARFDARKEKCGQT